MAEGSTSVIFLFCLLFCSALVFITSYAMLLDKMSEMVVVAGTVYSRARANLLSSNGVAPTICPL